MQDIVVTIGYGRRPGRFRVQVVESPVRDAVADVDLDVDALLGMRDRMMSVVLLSSVSARYNPSADERLIQEVGGILFTALLGTGEVHACYRSSADFANQRDERLRIALRIDAPELAALPWEAMHDQQGGGYVCREHELVRHVPMGTATSLLAVRRPLRILGITAAPSDLPALDERAEREQLARALSDQQRDGLVEVAWTRSATWVEIQERLMDGPWHVIHFIGHGDFDPERDEGRLALTRADGLADWVEASRFADLVRQATPMPRLTVLNSCQGATSSASDLFSGTAAVLARNRVTAVAAMQYPVSDDAAVAFAGGFYAALARGRGADEAVSAGRRRIVGLSGKTLEWLSPVLYLRGHQTQLFTLSGEAAPAESAKAPQSPSPAPGSGGTDAAAVPADQATRASAPLAATRPEPGSDHDPQPAGAFRGGADGGGEAGLVAGPSALLRDHTTAVRYVAYSPDGALLVSIGTDNMIRVWESEAGQLRGTLATDYAGTTLPRLTFGLDGKLLVATGQDGRLRAWELSTGESTDLLADLRVSTPYTSQVHCTAFSPDGNMMAVATGSTAMLLDAASHRERKWLNTRYLAVEHLVFSPDGTMLAGALSDGGVQLWDAEGGVPIRLLSPSASADTGWQQLAQQPARRGLGGMFKRNRTLDVPDQGDRYVRVRGMAFDRRGLVLAVGYEDGGVSVWSTRSYREEYSVIVANGPLRQLALGRDADRFAAIGPDETVHLLVRADSAAPATTEPGFKRIFSAPVSSGSEVALSPDDGQRLVMVDPGGDTYILDTRTAEPVHVLPGNGRLVRWAALSPDGARVATAGVDKVIRIWTL